MCLSNEYNKNINTYDFNELKTLLYNNIHKNEIIMSSLHKIYNTLMPCCHSQFMPFDLFKKYVEFFNDINFEHISNILKKYPILYPHWGGELQQKFVFQDLEYVINTELFLGIYHCILRV